MTHGGKLYIILYIKVLVLYFSQEGRDGNNPYITHQDNSSGKEL
jgi:hypothetical protein